MSQIEELQSRIAAAMDRIGTGLGAMSATQDTSAQVDMAQALEEEKLANAQLEERLKKLRAEMAEQPDSSGDLEALQAEVELLRNEVGNKDAEDALKTEVARLQSALESSGNNAASLEDELSEVKAENEMLKTAQGSADGDSAEHVDVAALNAEIESLQAKLVAAEAQAPGEDDTDTSSELARQNDMLVQLDNELQNLRQANEQLLSANTALRDANAEGVSDSELINSALVAEIDGLRAAQASDQAQVNVVLAKLEPLLANASNLPEGEEV